MFLHFVTNRNFENAVCIAGSVKLVVNLSVGTGKFEVTEAGTLVASGCVRAASDEELMFKPNDEHSTCESVIPNLEAMNLDSDDFYNQLRVRGFEYGPTFRGVLSTTGNGMQHLQYKLSSQLCFSGNRPFR
jgi:fatty acid synthase